VEFAEMNAEQLRGPPESPLQVSWAPRPAQTIPFSVQPGNRWHSFSLWIGIDAFWSIFAADPGRAFVFPVKPQPTMVQQEPAGNTADL